MFLRPEEGDSPIFPLRIAPSNIATQYGYWLRERFLGSFGKIGTVPAEKWTRPRLCSYIALRRAAAAAAAWHLAQ
jgi:hypothetical protein